MFREISDLLFGTPGPPLQDGIPTERPVERLRLEARILRQYFPTMRLQDWERGPNPGVRRSP